MAGIWNWLNFKFPSNPNHSVIVSFYDSTRAFRAGKDLIILRKIALPGDRRPFPLFQMLWHEPIDEAQSFPRGAGGFSHTICFKVQGSRAAKPWPAAPVCGLPQLQHLLVWWALWKALWVALNFPHKKNNYRLQAGKHWACRAALGSAFQWDKPLSAQLW